MGMFDSYEGIDYKVYPTLPNTGQKRALESTETVQLITDAKGNEVGLQINYMAPFELYFALEDLSCAQTLDEIMRCQETRIYLQFIDYWHNIILDKEFIAPEVYNEDYNILALSIDKVEEYEKLKKETYNINLRVFWPNGDYILFTEKDGFIMVR